MNDEQSEAFAPISAPTHGTPYAPTHTMGILKNAKESFLDGCV